jgi:hypothetical protein
MAPACLLLAIRISLRAAAAAALSLVILFSNHASSAHPLSVPQKPSPARVETAAEQLAIQIRLDGRGITALDGQVVKVPPPVDDAMPDLEVAARSADGTVLRQYAIRDPRRPLRDGAVWGPRRSSTTVVYVPITSLAKTLQVRPSKTRASAATTLDTGWRGGVIQLKPLLLSACRSHRDLPACVQVLRSTE